MLLGKLSAPGRPTNLDHSRAMIYIKYNYYQTTFFVCFNNNIKVFIPSIKWEIHFVLSGRYFLLFQFAFIHFFPYQCKFQHQVMVFIMLMIRQYKDIPLRL